MTGPGDNQLKSLIARIEQLEDGKAEIAFDIKGVYAQAKSNGYDVKALRAVIRRRQQDVEKLREHEQLVEVYMHALGMLADTPLGQAAVNREFADPPFGAPAA